MTTTSVAALVSRYGLLAVFGGTLLEGEGILIVAATLSAQGVLDPVRVWLVASAGAWLGHLFWFTTGRATRLLAAGHSLRQVAKALGVSHATVGRAVSKLLKQDLIILNRSPNMTCLDWDLEYKGWRIELRSSKAPDADGWRAYVTVSARRPGLSSLVAARSAQGCA